MATALEADAAPLGPWLSLSAGSLATAIPSAPGYLGTFDYFAAQGLVAYGAPPGDCCRFRADRPHAVVGAVDSRGIAPVLAADRHLETTSLEEYGEGIQ